MCYNSCEYFDSHRESCHKPNWAKCTNDIDREVEELEREKSNALDKLDADFEEKYSSCWTEEIEEAYNKEYYAIERGYDNLISCCENQNDDMNEYISMCKSGAYLL